VSDHGVKVTERKNEIPDLLKRLKGGTIRIGILADEPKKEQDGSESTASLIEVASAHELGLGVPRRSFLADWLSQNEAEVVRTAHKLMARVALGELSNEDAANQFGAWAVASVQTRIRNRIAPELAAETIARKGSSVPLIDTGQLWTSITWALGKSSA
jgi:hypothetical protein